MIIVVYGDLPWVLLKVKSKEKLRKRDLVDFVSLIHENVCHIYNIVTTSFVRSNKKVKLLLGKWFVY